MRAEVVWCVFLAFAVLASCADASGHLDAAQLDHGDVDAAQLDHGQDADADDLGHDVDHGPVDLDQGRACSGTVPCPPGYICVGRADDAGQVLTAFCEPYDP